MKEGVRSFIIEPSSEYIDFVSSMNDPSSAADDNYTFKGNIRLVTTKMIKVKSVTVKFIGESIVFQKAEQHEISTPILPKLKAKVQYKSAVLSLGEHLLPWEIDIPNIYPTSFSNKRGVIRYKIQIKISLGINKSVSADRSITIKRHMLPSQELAALVGTRTFENTMSNGFHYRIEVPRVVCIEQGYLPISIKYDYLDRSKKHLVKYILTHITQIELYRSRSVSKQEADMANTSSNRKSGAIFGQSLYELFKLGDPGLTRLLRPYRPVTINEIDKNNEDYSIVPLLVKQDLDNSLSHALESPLVAISHQLDVVFHFGQHTEDIRVKIPVIVSSVPDSDVQQSRPIQKYTLETVLHKVPFLVDRSDSITKPTTRNYRSTVDETVMNRIRQGLSHKSLKKSLSDLELKKVNSNDEKHQSMASSAPSNTHRHSQYTDDATVDTRSIDSLSSPTYSTFSSSDLSSSPKQSEIHFGTFTGLKPPPRRLKKKEDNPTSPKMKPLPNPMLPLPPIPSNTTEPIKKRLNYSKSTSTSSPSSPIRTKRSNSIEQSLIPRHIDKEKLLDISTYSSSITDRYVSAQLPPIPRQKLPSIPKKDHRLTRMYYDDDDSDEDDELA